MVEDSIPTRAFLAVHAELQASHPFDVLTYPTLGHALAPAVWDDVYRWLDSHGIR